MKPLFDVEWKVTIDDNGTSKNNFYWDAYPNCDYNKLGLDSDYEFNLSMNGCYKTTKGVINNWKRFAKVNKIKKWVLDDYTKETFI